MRISLVLFVLLSLLAVSAYAAPVNLGTSSTFGLLGGSGVTNTGSSVIDGDVGSSPTPAVTGFPPGIVIGTLYTSSNAVTSQAQSDLTTAYNAAAGASPTMTLTGTDLGFYNAANPLGPGVYFFASSAGLTGNLTLDAQGDPNAQWIFQIGSTLTTASDATVSFINGATPCHVFWQVGSSATIGTNNTFGGTIMALTSITLNGGTLNGRALARNGAVTISAAEFVNIVCPVAPRVTVAKTADRSVAAVGDPITYTYTVSNPGLAALTVNSVVDSRLGDLTADFVTANGGTSTLAPGAFTIFHETHTVLATDPSPLVNVFTAKASSGGVDVSDTAQASVVITTPAPSVTMMKTANRIVASAGDFVTYTFKVSNSGTAPLTVNSVVDSRLGDLTADFITANGNTAILPAGASTSFIEVYTVLNTDSSPLANTATVSASSNGTTVTGSDQASVLITAPAPSVTVVKKTDRAKASPGDVITYEYTVANSGSTPLTVSSIVDSALGNLIADFTAANRGSDILAIGASATFTKTYKVLATDKSPLVNSVTVHASGGGADVSNTTQASVIIITPAKPGIDVEKKGSCTTACVGDKVGYTVTVTNTGNVPLTNLVVNDSLIGKLCSFPSTLGVGASFTKCYTYVVTACTPDTLVNTVTVKANPKGSGIAVSDCDSWTVNIIRPGICIQKDGACNSACIGDKITYTIRVSNTGNTPLTNITVDDSLVGKLCGLPNTLAVGASFTKSYTYVVPADVSDTLTNDAGVKARPSCGGCVVCDNDSWYVHIPRPSCLQKPHSGICIEESVNKNLAKVGDKLIYTLTVMNVGNTKLTGIRISDVIAGNICNIPASLNPGDCFTRTFTHVITSKDKNPVDDEADIVAACGSSGNVQDRDCATVSILK